MKYLCTVVFSCLVGWCSAQQFGGNPFATQWKQINTDTARIIFPIGLDTAANRVAAIVHRLAYQQPVSLGNRLAKIDIVLQPQTTVPNGYVGLGPFRSEFFMTPPADNFSMGSLHWPDQLALHEYRHVQQYNNFYHGASRLMKIFFGEEGYALATNAAIPNWFFEGDAVYQETILSKQGRGRTPYFLKAYPALWRAGKNYSWMKLRNGSLKDYVPNHYQLGYLLVNYGYKKYGPEFWKNVTTAASAFKGLLYPMQRAVQQYSGLSYEKFTQQALEYYKKIYSPYNTPSIADTGTRRHNTVTHYLSPFQISEDSLLYLKSSYSQRPVFYIKDKSGEHFVRTKDISIDNEYSYKNGKIVYTAFENNPRWQWQDYSVIKIIDIKTGAQQTLQHKTRYFAPDISDDGIWVVANQVALNGQSSLILINTLTGLVTKEIKKDSITYFTTPRFVDNRSLVTVVRNKDATTYIAFVDINNGTIAPLTPVLESTIGQLFCKNGMVYFTAAHGLKDEIYRLHLHSRQLQKLKTDDLTSYFANAGFGKINWNTFTANGYMLRQETATNLQWEPASIATLQHAQNGIVAHVNDDAAIFLKQTNERKFTATRYPRLTRPFLLHSWRPNYDNPNFSFSVYGNNVLNTVKTRLYYLYNENEKSSAVGGSIAYAGIFPYISIGSRYTYGRNLEVKGKNKIWNQWDNTVSLGIPLSWTLGRRYHFFDASVTYGQRNNYHKGADKGFFEDERFGYMVGAMSYGQEAQRAVRDIFPKWGYRLSALYQLGVSRFEGWQYMPKATVFLPGLFANHHWVVSGTYRRTGHNGKYLGNSLPFARGFTVVDSASMGTVSVNYHFPIVYPDWGVGDIVYLQRIRGNMFYDCSFVKGHYGIATAALQSVGIEMYFDTKWWNQQSITLGIRGGRLLSPDLRTANQKFFVQLIFPVSIIPQ